MNIEIRKATEDDVKAMEDIGERVERQFYTDGYNIVSATIDGNLGALVSYINESNGPHVYSLIYHPNLSLLKRRRIIGHVLPYIQNGRGR